MKMNCRTNSFVISFDRVVSLLSTYLALGLLCSGTAAQDDDGSILNSPGTLYVFPRSGGMLWYGANFVDFLDVDESILPPSERFAANLMVPPANYSHLCEFPEALRNLGGYGAPGIGDAFSNIALMVSLGGGCDVLTKIQVALEIRERVTDGLSAIVFYDDNQDDSSDPLLLEGNDVRYFPANFSSNSIEGVEFLLFATLKAASSESIFRWMMDSMDDGVSPEFIVGQNNADWRFLITFERKWGGYSSGSGSVDGTRNSPPGFELVIFVFLALCPFIQMVRLWHSAGGRILLRRNENGRVVGIQYVAPQYERTWPNSLSNNHNIASGEPAHDRLTDEEVKALPEIKYRKPIELVDDGMNDVIPEIKPAAAIVATDELKSGCTNCNLIIEVNKADIPARSENIPLSVDALDQEETTSSVTTSPITISTACSICIEEFEDGEHIRLLPCGHAFHTECILPWLTERQGCCPLCKAKVPSESAASTNIQTIENSNFDSNASDETQHE